MSILAAAPPATAFAPSLFAPPPEASDPAAKPQDCQAEGLDCESCVRASARHVIQLCGHLPAERAAGMFFRIYPDVGCVPQARLFAKLCTLTDRD
jgi:hypothetical protein